MKTGKVLFFHDLKAYGFVERDNGPDVFVHLTEVKDGRFLKRGERVSFDIEETEKGIQAVNVEVLG